MTEWVSLADFKSDQAIDDQVLTRDDKALERTLKAAREFVQAYRPDLNYSGAWTVPEIIRLGTIRLAAHWSTQKSIDLGELGERRNTTLDRDIYLQLGIRRPFP